MLKAAQIALFDLGAQNFELLPLDTQGTAQGAQSAAQQAIQGNATLILGPLFANSVRAVKSATANTNINIVAFSTDWTLAGGNTFIMGFLPFDQVDRLTSYIASQNIQSVGLITPQSSYGSAVKTAFDRLAPQYGIQTTERLEFDPNTDNLAPQMRSFTRYDQRENNSAAADPYQAVLMPVGGNQATAISNLLSHYDLPPRTVKRLGTGLMDDLSLASETSLDGTWFAAPSPRLRKSFEEKFQTTYGYPAPRLSTLAYDATALAAILAQNAEKAGYQPRFSRSEITNPNGFFGIDGIFRFRPDGTAERGLAILEIDRGRFKVISTAPKTFEQRRY